MPVAKFINYPRSIAIFIGSGGIGIKRTIGLLLFVFLLSGIALGESIEKYEISPLRALSSITPQSTCVCVPDGINGDVSPPGCYPYDGCLGDGGGPCDDGIDNDCDCKVDCYDPQCIAIGYDCDNCNDSCNDPDCSGLPLGPDGQQCSPGGEPVEFCTDGFDNDADNYVDDCDSNCNGNANIQSRASPPYYPTSEICDNWDNNCNGQVDEGNVCVTCNSNAGCGTDGYVGSNFCISSNVYRKYRTYACNNPGTVNSYCSFSETNSLIQNCGSNSYSGSFCFDNDVYKNYTTKGC